MEVEHADSDLDQLETDPHFDGGRDQGLVRQFRKSMQLLRAAVDERDLHAQRGMRFEKLKGDRQHQHSIRLNRQWRLILEIEGEGPQKKVRVIGIEDYH